MAQVFRHSAQLLLATASNLAQTGASHLLQPSDTDLEGDKDASYRCFCVLTQSGGVTSPTSDVDLQTSADNANWITVASMTGLAADGSQVELLTPTALLPFVRAKTSVGGGTPPSHTAKVILMSDAPFTLTAQS